MSIEEPKFENPPEDKELGADIEKSLKSTQEALEKQEEKKTIEASPERQEELREARPGETEPYSEDRIKEGGNKEKRYWVDIAGDKLLKAVDWMGDRIYSGGTKIIEKTPERFRKQVEVVLREKEPEKKSEVAGEQGGKRNWVDTWGNYVEKGFLGIGTGIDKTVIGSEMGIRKLGALGLSAEMAIKEMGKKVFLRSGEILEKMREPGKTKQIEKRISVNLAAEARNNIEEIEETTERIEKKKGFFGRIKEIFPAGKRPKVEKE